jgi:hypothetical protein
VDNSQYNGHPGSPNLNYWEYANLVRLVPTPRGVKLEVLCADPTIQQYNGKEEIIKDDFDREQVHMHIAFRNEFAELLK